MAIEFKLEVQPRNDTGKKASKTLRQEGFIPGVYYSSDSKSSIHFFIEKKVLGIASKSGAHLYKINVGGKLRTVLFKDVQYHPVTDEVLHVDLYGVKMDEKVQIKVPLILHGDPVGVLEEGGNLTQPLVDLDIICLPTEIPDNIEIDVSEMHIGESMHAGDITLADNVELAVSSDVVVASVSHAMREEDLISTVPEEEEDITFEEGEEPTTDEEDKAEGEPSQVMQLAPLSRAPPPPAWHSKDAVLSGVTVPAP